jgi:GAF domain-containing protein
MDSDDKAHLPVYGSQVMVGAYPTSARAGGGGTVPLITHELNRGMRLEVVVAEDVKLRVCSLNGIEGEIQVGAWLLYRTLVDRAALGNGRLLVYADEDELTVRLGGAEVGRIPKHRLLPQTFQSGFADQASKEGRSDARRDFASRRDLLQEMEILDTPAEEEYDRIAALACTICGTPMGTITFVEEDRQWFKARVGVERRETPLSESICAIGVQQTEPTVVEDATQDPRFRDNGSVTGHPHIRFYAGVPLVPKGEVPVGTLCVFDSEPRRLEPQQYEKLKVLADQVSALLWVRRLRGSLDGQSEEATAKIRELDQMEEQLRQAVGREP